MRRGKTRLVIGNEKLTLTGRVREQLENREGKGKSRFVFPGTNVGAIEESSLSRHLHEKTRRNLKLPGAFVLYCLRQTMLTRLVESGCRCFHHYASCCPFLDHHFSTICSSLFRGVELGDRAPSFRQ